MIARDSSKTTVSNLELVIGRLLRTGVALASTLLVAGLALAAFSPVWSGSFLQAGLMVLIATPAARVVAAIIEYASQRDWRFAALSALVLIELVAGAIAAAVFHRVL